MAAAIYIHLLLYNKYLSTWAWLCMHTATDKYKIHQTNNNCKTSFMWKENEEESTTHSLHLKLTDVKHSSELEYSWTKIIHYIQ